MANPTGFLQYPRIEIGHRPIDERIRDWHEIDRPLIQRVLDEQASRCMDCGIPFCHAVGCPVQKPHSRVQRSGLSQPLARGGLESAFDQQFPRNHRPGVPRSVRSGLHAGLERSGRQHQAHRVADRRAGVRRGLDRAAAAEGQDGQKGGRRRFRARGSRRCPAIGPAGTRRGRLRERRPARRAACVTAFPISSSKSTSSTAAWSKWSPKACSSSRTSTWASNLRPTNCEEVRRDRAVHGRGPAARTSRPRGGTFGRPFRDGLFAAAKPPCGRAIPICHEWGLHRPQDPRHGQARHRGRRRRYGQRLRRHGDPPKGPSVTQLEILPKPPEGYNPETPWPFWPKIMRTSSSQEEGCERRWSTLTEGVDAARKRAASRNFTPAKSIGSPGPRAGRWSRSPAPISRCRPIWC